MKIFFIFLYLASTSWYVYSSALELIEGFSYRIEYKPTIIDLLSKSEHSLIKNTFLSYNQKFFQPHRAIKKAAKVPKKPHNFIAFLSEETNAPKFERLPQEVLEKIAAATRQAFIIAQPNYEGFGTCQLTGTPSDHPRIILKEGSAIFAQNVICGRPFNGGPAFDSYTNEDRTVRILKYNQATQTHHASMLEVPYAFSYYDQSDIFFEGPDHRGLSIIGINKYETGSVECTDRWPYITTLLTHHKDRGLLSINEFENTSSTGKLFNEKIFCLATDRHYPHLFFCTGIRQKSESECSAVYMQKTERYILRIRVVPNHQFFSKQDYDIFPLIVDDKINKKFTHLKQLTHNLYLGLANGKIYTIEIDYESRTLSATLKKIIYQGEEDTFTQIATSRDGKFFVAINTANVLFWCSFEKRHWKNNKICLKKTIDLEIGKDTDLKTLWLEGRVVHIHSKTPKQNDKLLSYNIGFFIDDLPRHHKPTIVDLALKNLCYFTKRYSELNPIKWNTRKKQRAAYLKSKNKNKIIEYQK